MKEGLHELLSVILILILEFACGTTFLYVVCLCFHKVFTWDFAIGIYAAMQMVSMYIRIAIIETKK